MPIKSIPWVKDIPSHIKPKYTRFVLIDGDMAAPGLPEKDNDTLFITTSWIAWCRSLYDLDHCLHYEAGLVDWSEQGAPVQNFVGQIENSIYSRSTDPTLFMGVSVLESLISVPVNIGRIFLRLDAALNSLIDNYKPTEIIFHSLKFEKRDLSTEHVSKAVEIIAQRRNCNFINKSMAFESAHPKRPHHPNPIQAYSKELFRAFLINTYVKCVSVLSRVRKKISPHKDCVFIQPTGTMIAPLLDSYNGQDVIPIFLARQLPKKLATVLQCIWKGMMFVEHPVQCKTSETEQVTKKIINNLDQIWASEDKGTSTSLSTFMRYFVRKELIESGSFHDVIEKIIAFDAFIELHKIRRVVCSGFLNPQAMIFLQLAREKGIPTDDALHGLRVNRQKYPQLNQHGAQPPLVSRLLAWGQQNADWLSGLQSDTEATIVGYMGMNDIRPFITPPENSKLTALVLPFEPDRDNIIGLHSHSFAALAEIVHVLTDKNYDVIIKVHPGMKKDTYLDLVEHYDLNCQVIQKGEFQQLAEQADILVGPMNTSAMIQALASGKPYYPCAIPPTVDEPEFILNHAPSTCGEDFSTALRQNRYLDNKKILTYFCGADKQQFVFDRFWKAMAIENKGTNVTP